MSKVLIIGAGGVGGVVAQKCAQVPEVFSHIVLASRTVSKGDAIAAKIDNVPVETAQVDADNVPELVELIRKVQPKMIINVALPYQDLPIMDACLETARASTSSSRLPEQKALQSPSLSPALDLDATTCRIDASPSQTGFRWVRWISN